MAIANFGLDLRPNSQVVQTDEERAAAYNAYISQMAAARDRQAQQLPGALDAFAKARVDAVRAQGFNVGDDYFDIVKQAATSMPGGWTGDARNYTFGLTGDEARLGGQYATLRSGVDGFAGAMQSASSAFNGENQDRATSQAAQQQAYNTSTLGGGNAGGVLPGIADQGTLDPTQQASWNSPWMQPGFGNPGSLGGLGGYKPQGASQQQNGGWGGVFNGKNNPWSIA